MQEKIIEKIRKLLSLAENNPNPSEAESAMLKAQKLLLQYKIEMKEIKDTKKVKIIEAVTNCSANTPWARALGGIISDNFRCMFFLGRISKRDRKVVFLGEEDDAIVAQSMYDYAFTWVNKNSSKYATNMRNKYGIVKGVKQDYILGFLSGLKSKFDEQIKSNESYAMVVVTPKEVNDEFQKLKLKNVQFSNSIQCHGSQQARQAGYNDGRNFSTNMIGGKSNGKGGSIYEAIERRCDGFK